MTSYSRLEENRSWESGMNERKWLYQTRNGYLIKASNGASDFGNKFGQYYYRIYINFEHEEDAHKFRVLINHAKQVVLDMGN
jgi:phosphoribosylformylglycinamidine synthase